MSWWMLLGVAVGLAMDAFAVSIVAGMTVSKLTGRHVFRLAFHFGLFQFLMPVAGWLAGREVARYAAAYDHWVAFVLLTVIGGKMLWEARSDEYFNSGGDPSRGLTLVSLSIATSIDALAVGLSIAMLNESIWLAAVVIGLVAAALSTVGVLFGNRLGTRCGRWAAAAGGCVLLGIGVRILVSHLVG